MAGSYYHQFFLNFLLPFKSLSKDDHERHSRPCIETRGQIGNCQLLILLIQVLFLSYVHTFSCVVSLRTQAHAPLRGTHPAFRLRIWAILVPVLCCPFYGFGLRLRLFSIQIRFCGSVWLLKLDPVNIQPSGPYLCNFIISSLSPIVKGYPAIHTAAWIPLKLVCSFQEQQILQKWVQFCLFIVMPYITGRVPLAWVGFVSYVLDSVESDISFISRV